MNSKSTNHEQNYAQIRLAAILAIAADAIISTDAHQKITLFNKGAEQIFGYSETETLGKSLEILLPERFRVAHAGHVQKFGSTATAARQMGERQMIFGRRKSGEEFPAEASIAKLTIGSEQTYTVVLRDISQRKSAEAFAWPATKAA
jgi:PAS domain S-box-containing protein